MSINKEVLSYLNQLKNNNNREWFQENKKTYETMKNEMKDWFSLIEEGLNNFDLIERTKIFRIYRDVRFSKDKTPYKSHFSANLVRATAKRRGSYYVHIEPENKSFIASGFYQPEREDLYRIRKEFEMDDEPMRNILKDKDLLTYFPEGLKGDELKTAPRDFEKDHPAIDLIRKKSFYFSKEFTDKEVLAKDFAETVVDSLKATLPYLDYMTEVVTTDLNGESLL